MNLTVVLEMAAATSSQRVAVGPRSTGLTYEALLHCASRVAATLHGADRLAMVDVNSDAVPTMLFASAIAGVPFVPLNYRLKSDQLRSILSRTAPCVAVVDDQVAARVRDVPDVDVRTREAVLAEVDASEAMEPQPTDPDDIAVLLHTSGTTGDPKAAVLRHRHLTSYVISSVEFMGAADDDATLVSVPPYHVAGLAAIVSAVYAGRRLVYLPEFSADSWVDLAVAEQVTHAMVVPTMLGRVLDVLEQRGQSLPALRHLSYGGGRMPMPVVERAMAMLPEVDMVNAYGLTETSSTISVLGPDDHRHASASGDPEVRARLGSVGRPLPTVELEIRDADGRRLPPGSAGEIFVRGDQVSGEYLNHKTSGDDGWFPTNDSGWLDKDGYLFVEGRLDDVIVRGAENLSPGEIEDALVTHPSVSDAGVVGLPDDEWGETVAAVVVPAPGASPTVEELQAWVRERLRSTKTPTVVVFQGSLPYGETGKLLRRALRAHLLADQRAPASTGDSE